MIVRECQMDKRIIEKTRETSSEQNNMSFKKRNGRLPAYLNDLIGINLVTNTIQVFRRASISIIHDIIIN